MATFTSLQFDVKDGKVSGDIELTLEDWDQASANDYIGSAFVNISDVNNELKVRYLALVLFVSPSSVTCGRVLHNIPAAFVFPAPPPETPGP